MRLTEIREIVDSTGDPAFAVDGAGTVVAWNSAATEAFGVSAGEVKGHRCCDLVKGSDERGSFCSAECAVRQSARRGRNIRNFDLLLQTKAGMQWHNVSILIVRETSSLVPYAIHILRNIHTLKRLEILVRDFLMNNTGLSPEESAKVLSASRAPARVAELSRQELAVLRLLAKGSATRMIAQQLHISPATVNNHIQHILAKLDVHTRLEAIRRAESAGLI